MLNLCYVPPFRWKWIGISKFHQETLKINFPENLANPVKKVLNKIESNPLEISVKIYKIHFMGFPSIFIEKGFSVFRLLFSVFLVLI